MYGHDRQERDYTVHSESQITDCSSVSVSFPALCKLSQVMLVRKSRQESAEGVEATWEFVRTKGRRARALGTIHGYATAVEGT